MQRALAPALASLLVATAWTGCGSELQFRNRSETIVIEGTGDLDGFVRTDGVADQAGGGPAVGDLDFTSNGLALRMFYSFDLSEIPPGVVLTSVTLRIFQQGSQGSPFGDLGDLLVDHVDFGTTLEAVDYAGGTLASNVGVISMDGLQVYKNLGVSSEVQADIDAGRPRSQFRLRFPVDANGDGGNDLVLLDDGEDSRGTGNLPLLEVTYVTP